MSPDNEQTDAVSDQSPERKLFYLVAGEIVFQAEGEEMPHTIRSNAVVMSSTGNFAVPQIAMAQQALQHIFHTRMGADAKINVLDVVILGLMQLGWFTSEEFNKAPVTLPEGFPVTSVPAEEAEKLA